VNIYGGVRGVLREGDSVGRGCGASLVHHTWQPRGLTSGPIRKGKPISRSEESWLLEGHGSSVGGSRFEVAEETNSETANTQGTSAHRYRENVTNACCAKNEIHDKKTYIR